MDNVRIRSFDTGKLIRITVHPVAIIFFAIFLGIAAIMLVLGRTGAIDTHFTNNPETIPDFAITPWHQSSFANRPCLAREATLKLSLYTLRYDQVTFDLGATTEATAHNVDIRWGLVFGIVFPTLLIAWLALLAGVVMLTDPKPDNYSER